MKPVSPNFKSTLVLSGGFEPLGFCNARSAIRNTMVGAVKAYDHHGNIHDWSSWLSVDTESWTTHPCLRSSDAEYAVPTIVVVPGYFNKRKQNGRKHKSIKLRQLYNIYDGKCQYCCKQIPYNVATRDHVLPRCKGGSNCETNIVLSCKKCNLKKGSKYPYHNVTGNAIVPKILSDVEFFGLSECVSHRPEWNVFISDPREQILIQS